MERRPGVRLDNTVDVGMNEDMDVFSMQFSKVFPLLIAKAERKGRTRDDMFTVTTWMTGYSAGEIEALLTPEAMI